MHAIDKAKILHASVVASHTQGILRRPQRDALVAMANKSSADLMRCYFKLPTGFGKTVMFVFMASEYIKKLPEYNQSPSNNKVIILVPRLSLFKQTAVQFERFANIRQVGVFNHREKDIDHDVIISTYKSAKKLFDALGTENIGLVIADEAHHAVGPSIMRTLQDIDAPIVGFTATPAYSGGHSVSDLLTSEIYTMTIADGVKSGMLAPVKNILCRTSVVLNSITAPRESDGDFDYTKISRRVNLQALMHEIADIYINGGDYNYVSNKYEHFRGLRTIINCPNIDIAIAQADKINKLAGKDVAIAVHSRLKSQEFDSCLGGFLNGKYNVACQVNTLTEGLDDPSVSLCINYPSCSVVKIEQASGRILRPQVNKFAYVLDTVFRGAPNETLQDTMKNVVGSGQVLFCDIADAVVLLPGAISEHGVNSGVQTSTPEMMREFDVVTDQILLTRLMRQRQKWITQNEIDVAGQNDLNASQLATKLGVPATKIYAKLKWMRPSMPYAIRKKRADGMTALHLQDKFYDKFIKNAGIQQQTLPPIKSSDWVSAWELKNQTGLTANTQTINAQLQKLKTKMQAMPNVLGDFDKIQVRRSRFRNVLCLHKDYINAFLMSAGLIVASQRDNWLGQTELKEYIDAPENIIARVLKLLKSDDDLLVRTIRHRRGETACLYAPSDKRLEIIDQFIQRAGQYGVELIRRSSGVSNYLNVPILMQKFPEVGAKRLRAALKAFAEIAPDKIKITKGSRKQTLRLHKDALDAFSRFSGLYNLSLVESVSDDYLSPEKLSQQYIFASREKIRACLAQLQSAMRNDIKLLRDSKNKTFLYLHKNAIDRFCEKSGMINRASVPQKTEQDLTGADIAALVDLGGAQVSALLDEMRGRMSDPNAIRRVRSRSNLIFVLQQQYLEEFIAKSGLRRRNKSRQDFVRGTNMLRTAQELNQINTQYETHKEK